MRADKYLQQIEKIDKLIENKIAESERWKEIAMGSSPFSEGERVQSSGSKQKMADAVARYVDLEAEINAEIDFLVDKKQEIIRMIEKLPAAEYDVLHKRYVMLKDLRDIATDISDRQGKAYNTAYSWVTTVHGRAMAHLQKLLNEREKDEQEKKH